MPAKALTPRPAPRVQSCRILLVEDDAVDYLAFERQLVLQEYPWTCTWVGSLKEAKHALTTEAFDIVITDYRLGDGMGLELAGATHGIPLIFVTGAGNQEVAVNAMKAGAYDYIIKDHDRHYLQLIFPTIQRCLTHRQMEIEAIEAQQEIKNSLEEKELLLKEVHHRVKNNLQIIASLLNLQMARLQDEKGRAALRECHHRVQSMALIHQKLYDSGNLSRIDFNAYVRSLATELFDSYQIEARQISMNVDVEDAALAIDYAIPLGLILNELMSNALKYAFPDSRSGEIRVALKPSGPNEWTFDFSDNGIGIKQGPPPPHSPSLGVKIIEALSRQMKGKAEWRDQGGRGFKLIFRTHISLGLV